MSSQAHAQKSVGKSMTSSNSRHAGLLLQRKCACGSPTASLTGECEECKATKRVQTKLVVGERHDRLEQEADQVANQVLAAPASLAVSSAPPGIQRFTGESAGQGSGAPASVDSVLASPGKPLDTATQRDMGQRFGYDFSQVRVHADGAAGQSARELDAHAYTVGRDIVFGAGRFAPATHDGRRLLAHELAHVIQQRGEQAGHEGQHDAGRGRAPLVASGRGAKAHGALELSEPTDTGEQEAERVANSLFPSSLATASAMPGSRQDRPAQGAGGGAAASCKTCGSSGKLPGGMADRGSPLPAHVRTEMEHAFGVDLSAVRIHTNPGAAQVSRSLNAEAFTYGNDIFFDQGKYDPDSLPGKRLLAHELTHTVQQRDAIAMLARDGEGRTTLQCVNENLSSAGVASWLLAIVGTTCGLIFGIAGSPTGPGAAGTAAAGAAICIAGVIGASVGAVLGVISGCWNDPNFKSRGANLK